MKTAPVLCLFLCACGGGSAADVVGTSGADLNAAFAGTWNGTTMNTVPGVGTVGITASGAVITVSGHAATVSEICRDGSGSLTATGSGNLAAWSGTSQCPGYSFSEYCASIVFNYTSGTATLDVTMAPAQLTLTLAGTAVGCGLNGPLTYTLIAAEGLCTFEHPCG